MLRRELGIWGALVLGLAVAATPARSQSAGALPNRDTLNAQTGTNRPQPTPRVKIEGDIERSPCALADPAYASIKITPKSFEFNNIGPVDPASLASAYAHYIGKESPVSVICEVRDAAATLLRQRGYLAAVQVPTQRIEDGHIKLEVLYARITNVRVQGDAGRNELVFKRYLSHLSDGAVFNRFEVERYLLLARDVPGYDLRLVLKPADTGAGDMIGEVTLARTPIAMDLVIQNYAAPETGRFGGQLRAEVYGLTGMGDRTSLSFYSSGDFKEQQILAAGHDFLVGGEGLRLGGRASYAWTHPTLAAGTPLVRARTLFATIDARYPIVRSLAGNLAATAGLDFVDQKVRFNGVPLSRDQLRIGFIRLDGDAIDMRGRGSLFGDDGGTLWRLSGTLEVRQGFDIFNASPNCVSTPAACSAAGVVPPSLTSSDPTAFLVRFAGRAEIRLTPGVTIAIAPRGQYSGASLPAFEQFSLGNYTIGRGFDPGTLAGDSGIGVAAELSLGNLGIAAKRGVFASPYVFFDTAWVWSRYALPGVDPLMLASAGGGLRMNWADHARLDIGLAVPVRSAGSRQAGDVRFLVSLTTRLLPWGNR